MNKSPEEIAFEICKQLTSHIHLVDGATGLMALNHAEAEPLIAAAIAAEGAKQQAVVWPSEEDLNKRIDLIYGVLTPHNELGDYYTAKCNAYRDCFNWLKSQVKPVELPTFTDDEVFSLIRDYYEDLDGKDFTLDWYRECTYYNAFKKAIELIKSRIDGGK